MNEKPGLEAVRKFLEERGEGADGLTAQNLSARTVETEDPEHRDCVVFEVKRESILMDSFNRCPRAVEVLVTCWFRYSFNPEAKTLEKLNNQSAPSFLTDWAAVVENDVADTNFSFQLLGRGHTTCKVAGPRVKEELRVVNFEDVERRIQDIANKLHYEDIAGKIVRRAGTGDPVAITKRLREEFCNGAVAKVRPKWEKYMEDPEANSDRGRGRRLS